jgi:hypothetical protein
MQEKSATNPHDPATGSRKQQRERRFDEKN